MHTLQSVPQMGCPHAKPLLFSSRVKRTPGTLVSKTELKNMFKQFMLSHNPQQLIWLVWPMCMGPDCVSDIVLCSTLTQITRSFSIDSNEGRNRSIVPNSLVSVWTFCLSHSVAGLSAWDLRPPYRCTLTSWTRSCIFSLSTECLCANEQASTEVLSNWSCYWNNFGKSLSLMDVILQS